MPLPEPQILTLDEVADELATSRAQIYVLVRRGELPATKRRGRDEWHVERASFENYLDRA